MNTNVKTSKQKSIVDLSQAIKWSLLRITKNLICVSLSTFLLFTGYAGISYLQSTINTKAGVGVASQAVIYAFACLSSLFLPKIVIRKLGCKLVLVWSVAAYCPYIAANFYPTWTTLLLSAILLGISAGLFWAANFTYVSQLSAIRAKDNIHEDQESVAAFYLGVVGTFHSVSVISGNIVSFAILNKGSSASTSNKLCGLNFVRENSLNLNLTSSKEIGDDFMNLMTGILFGSGILAVLLLLIFLDSLPTTTTNDSSTTEKLKATYRMLKEPNQLLLMPFSLYYGLIHGFVIGDFTEAYIACSWGIRHVGLVITCYGIFTALFSSLAGRMTTYVGRIPIFALAGATNVITFILLFTFKPHLEQAYVFFIIAALWGIFNGIYFGQLRAFYGSLFIGEEESAFASYYLWNSIGNCLAFSYSEHFSVPIKLYIVISIFILSQTGYIIVERKNSAKHKKEPEVKNLEIKAVEKY